MRLLLLILFGFLTFTDIPKSMKKYFSFVHCLFFSAVCFSQQFPVTKKTPATITKYGITFEDDYTWLENMESEAVMNWTNAQNEVVNRHLEEIKKSYSSAAKIKEYDRLSSNGLPTKKRKYFYSIYYRSKNSPANLYYRKAISGEPIELVNPSKIYKDPGAFLLGYYPSRNSKLLAFDISPNGSDKTEVRFMDIESFKISDELLTNVKSSVAWNQDAGVFYKKNNNLSTFAKDSTYQLYYHKIGSLQQDDKLIFDTTKTESNFSFRAIQDKLFIIETNKEETLKNYYYVPLASEDLIPQKFITDDSSDFDFLSYRDGRIYFSKKEFDWGEVRSFDLRNRSDETVIIPQIYTHLLLDSFFYEDYIVCKYRTLKSTYLIVYDRNGTFVRKFEAPFGMDIRIRFLDSDSKKLYVSFSSFTIPYLNYTLNIATGAADPFFTTYLPPKPTLFPFDHFETKIVTYKSRDNEDIPITIVHKKGIALDGNNPTLFEAYGAFGVVNSAAYDTGLLYFLEKGGVYAYAALRGGGEKGLKWHEAGKGLNKINTFNDFVDGAEFLIREKYTSAKKLAITGSSQGGLLVGVAMTQRPDLFKLVIARMGAYDMADFGKYTTGKFHYDEYGNPAIEREYRSLLGYSPYHNIKDDVNYPTTLIVTSENDDRVPPLHSYKFAARLQGRAAQKNPVYLQTLKTAGHYGKVDSYNNNIDSEADFYNFLLYHLNQ
jgi:prolyl oligopeptidase